MNIDNLIRLVRIIIQIDDKTEYAIRAAWELDKYGFDTSDTSDTSIETKLKPKPKLIALPRSLRGSRKARRQLARDLEQKLIAKNMSYTDAGKKIGVHLSTVRAWIKRGSVGPTSVERVMAFLKDES
jgi:hypothetical protein